MGAQKTIISKVLVSLCGLIRKPVVAVEAGSYTADMVRLTKEQVISQGHKHCWQLKLWTIYLEFRAVLFQPTPANLSNTVRKFCASLRASRKTALFDSVPPKWRSIPETACFKNSLFIYKWVKLRKPSKASPCCLVVTNV